MPFTLSHPAAVVLLFKVLPCSRWGLSLSALIVGSVVSDLPRYKLFTHFVHLPGGKHFAHTFSGIYLFCVPVGMLLLLAFHIVMKAPLMSLLPINHQERLAPIAVKFQVWPFRRFVLIIASLILGALSHIVWDSLTHASRWPGQHLSVLHMPILQTAQGTFLVSNFLHLCSTLIGGALLTYWCLNWLRPGSPGPVRLLVTRQTKLLICMAVAALILGAIYSYWKTGVLFQLSWKQPFLRRTVVSGGAVASLEMLIFSFYWHWRASKNFLWRKPTPSPIHNLGEIGKEESRKPEF